MDEVIAEGMKQIEVEIREAVGMRYGQFTADSPLRAGVAPMLASLRDKFSVACLAEPSLREVEERIGRSAPRFMEDALRQEIEILARDVAREALGTNKPK